MEGEREDQTDQGNLDKVMTMCKEIGVLISEGNRRMDHISEHAFLLLGATG